MAVTQFDPNVWKQWTPQDWIDEAIGQYVESRSIMQEWEGLPISSKIATIAYQHAANATQRAIAAASIATAKLNAEATEL